jgi:ABC-type transporter Mla MlaB component
MSNILSFEQQSERLRLRSEQSALTRDTLSEDGWMALSKTDIAALKTAADIRMDLSTVGSVDSAGLAWLLNLKRDALKERVSITFCAVPDKLHQLAALSGVCSLINSGAN